MKNKNRRWLFIWMLIAHFIQIFQCEFIEVNIFNSTSNGNEQNATAPPTTSQKDLRSSVFSPRMDYEQWTPIGRGDPLKNDPTYDYVPPVLEHVHYWMDPALRKPDPPLPSGAAGGAVGGGDNSNNKKTEILVLGVSSKKPSSTAADSRRDTYDTTFIKFVDGPKYQNSYQRIPASFYPYSYYSSPYYNNNKNKIIDRPHYTKNEHRVPYTILMPPPVPTTTRPSTEKYEKHSNVADDVASSTQSPAAATAVTTIQEAASLIHQSSTSSNRNEWKNENEFYTVGESSSHVTWRTPLPYHEYKRNQTNYNKNQDKHEINLHTTINSSDGKMMFKGQVSDGDMDLESTYVNIGKPEAQVHSGLEVVVVEPPSSSSVIMMKPLTLQTLQTMQPPPPPPPAPSPVKRPISSLPNDVTSDVLSTMTSFIANIPKATTKAYTTTTTPTPPTTTSLNSLTTDPLFKHYKQPSEPLRGPMYLIIQGHSKVKTYGPSRQVHGIKIQEINEIPSSDYYNKHQSDYQVKHLHTAYRKKSEESSHRIGKSNNKFKTLSQVVQTGFGAIDYVNRRHDVNDDVDVDVDVDDDTQETELVAGFKVAPREDVTSEVYHKGFVDNDNDDNNAKEAN